MPNMHPKNNYQIEINLTLATLLFSFIAWGMVTWETTGILYHRIQFGDNKDIIEQIVFILIVQTLLYGNFVYQLTRIGYLKRRLAHKRLPQEELEQLYDGEAPSLSILIPTYREEIAVIHRTLISAALQDYPKRHIALLVDDPPKTHDPVALKALHDVRKLPKNLQEMFDEMAAPFVLAHREFESRESKGAIDLTNELAILASHYENAALHVEAISRQIHKTDHADSLLHEKVLSPISQSHQDRAKSLINLQNHPEIHLERIRREYNRLAALFSVKFTSFERKRYVNLSHEPNKAMNLNSYIGLLGGKYHEEKCDDGLHLKPAESDNATLHIPNPDFLITLDADSVLVPEYALLLVNEMLRPGNEKLAVVQTPYNSIPNSPGVLERVAGATTDIQYLIHQGFTQHHATYWVGANALLRPAALHCIKEEIEERGFRVPVFIQDRTVIEDTESTVDLIVRGWKLYNYPERLAFSATPPDFGSLMIQRRRWANGGLIILPKLIQYLLKRPYSFSKLREGFFRVHYLGSIAAVNIGLLIALGYTFESSIESVWLPLTAIPYFFLYARDLRYNGYPISDVVRVYALNLLLIPINLSGVAKSIQQGVSGQRIPFGRTPKILGRTSAPIFFILAEYGLLLWWIICFALDIENERWTSAVFIFINACLMAYAIYRFIGLRESWEDICLGAPSLHIQLPHTKYLTLSNYHRYAKFALRTNKAPQTKQIPKVNPDQSY